MINERIALERIDFYLISHNFIINEINLLERIKLCLISHNFIINERNPLERIEWCLISHNFMINERNHLERIELYNALFHKLYLILSRGFLSLIIKLCEKRHNYFFDYKIMWNKMKVNSLYKNSFVDHKIVWNKAYSTLIRKCGVRNSQQSNKMCVISHNSILWRG